MRIQFGSILFECSVAFTLCIAGSAAGQASFFEGFNHATTEPLETAGWIFRNQSEPAGALGWRPADVTDPYEGTHYLVTDGYCVGGVGPAALGSNWAILPAIDGLTAGDPMEIYLAEGWSALRYDVLEIRYAPNGGTDTGSSASDVGDFTVLLASFPHDTIGWWGPHEITLPGSGRIALRYYVPQGQAASMYVDALTIGMAPPGAIPIPEAGEVVHWDANLSPIVFDGGTVNIPDGGTVIVDSGVEVRLESASTLHVRGNIDFSPGTALIASPDSKLLLEHGGAASFLGTESEPVVFTGSQNPFTPGLQVFFGSSLTMQHVEASVFGWISAASVASIHDCSFTRSSTLPLDVAGFRLYNGTLALRGCSFDGGLVSEEGGYLLVDDLTLDDSQLVLYRESSPQPMLVDHLTARHVAEDAPIVVHNHDVLLGPNNLIESNLYPVRLETGGLAPGSIVPSAGNTLNHIRGLARMSRRATWSNVGLPYVLAWDSDIPPSGGRLTVEPGVTARFERGEGSDSFPIEFSAEFICRGTPEAPITLSGQDGAWGGLFFGDNDRKRPVLRHTLIQGADIGVIATLGNVRLEDCVLSNNGIAARSTSFGSVIARGTRFLDNGIGVETSEGSGSVGSNAGRADLFGLTNPNGFVGNGVGLSILNPSVTQVDARHGWWGDASGPTHPDNPDGQGDSASDSAEVIPFRVTDPFDGDFAPRVTLQTLANVLEEGTRMILHWEVEDEGTIVAQRLEYSPHGTNPPLTVLIDDIPPAARSVEVVVPSSPPSSNLLNPVFRLIAVDDAGHEGWDEGTFFTPFEDSSVQFAVEPMPSVIHPGEEVEVCWSIAGGSAYLIIDDLAYAFDLGSTTTDCLPLGMTAPGVSTDTARVAVAHTIGAGGRVRYEYSNVFSIRPDPAIGDTAPSVELLAPQGGSLTGGSNVTISWAASDDEGLRSFDLQASYDGGRTWNFIVGDLSPDTMHYDWQTPTKCRHRRRAAARDREGRALPVQLADGASLHRAKWPVLPRRPRRRRRGGGRRPGGSHRQLGSLPRLCRRRQRRRYR